jgi:DNA-binding MarR family transcriptional regulator
MYNALQERIMANNKLSKFLAEVVLTSHYLAEPVSKTEAEISDAEMKCLKIITSFEPIGMQEIAAKLHASKPRATQLVALLESHGMVDRTVASDRRRIVVRASAKGKKAVTILDKRYDALAEAIEKCLGKDDTDTLVRLLEQITPLNKLQQ